MFPGFSYVGFLSLTSERVTLLISLLSLEMADNSFKKKAIWSLEIKQCKYNMVFGIFKLKKERKCVHNHF